MPYKYKSPDGLTPSQLEMEQNTGKPKWWWDTLKSKADENGEIPRDECERMSGDWAVVVERVFEGQIAPIAKGLSQVNGRLDVMGKTLKHVEQQNKELEFKRKEDLDRINKNEYQVEMLRQSLIHNSNQAGQTLEMVKMIHESQSATNDRLSSIDSRLNAVKSSPAKPSAMTKIPVYAWALIGAGAVGAVAFLVTGDDSLLKLLGGSK